MKRVAITGVGVVSPVGNTIEEFWSALVEARSGIRPITGIDTSRLNTAQAAQVQDFDPADHFAARKMSLLDRFSQFAVVAARAAVAHSGIAIDEELALRTATIIGTGAGGMHTLDDSFRRVYGEDARKIHPFSVPRGMDNAAASQVSIDIGTRGPAFAIVSACASGAHAIGLGFQMIRSGMAPLAIVGASEACLTVGTIIAWQSLRVLSDDLCRPFSRNRSGLVLGEGAAVLVLEDWDHAAARGARIIAEVRGFGMSADANDAIAPDRDGAERAMRAALLDAGADVADIDYVNAHGTGTRLNDATETQAIRGVFGPDADRLAVSSNKGVLGHGLGVAGAFEAIATALTLQSQVVPPTANYQEPDPDCDLDIVPNTARAMPVRAALSNSFAFGGLNAVLAFGPA